MTSKHCFSKTMREDFRHKVWLLALSILGNLLALPVGFLLAAGNSTGYNTLALDSGLPDEIIMGRLLARMSNIEDFFCAYMTVTAGIIAVAGAVLVGLFGFRYVFHRNMVDNYHSMPVKRKTLFAATWLNGFLIWLVPFLAGVLATLVMGEVRLGMLKKSAAALTGITPEQRVMLSNVMSGGGLALNTLISVLVLLVVFLLVYHLVLLAAMLCGNVLNTLVTALVLGVGAVSVYGMLYAFCIDGFKTFLVMPVPFGKIVYASPLVSGIWLLAQRVIVVEGLTEMILINALIAVALGLLAWFAHNRRPSELAEQGIKNKPVKFTLQIVTTFVAALGGWMLFHIFTSFSGAGHGLGWGIFGALLAGILVCGVMDIIFHMDFKSFFAHKILMIVTVAAGLLMCFCFRFDWLGYDSYLPEKEEVAEIGIHAYSHRNDYESYYDAYSYDDVTKEDTPFNRVHIRDNEKIYAFLQAVVQEDSQDTESQSEKEMPSPEIEDVRTETVRVKVTLKSGRTYYRVYSVISRNKAASDALYALLVTPEYLDVNFRVSQEQISQMTNIRLRREYSWKNISEELSETEVMQMTTEFCEAYNRDLEENPDAFIRGDGRLLCQVSVSGRRAAEKLMDIYEGMKHTREVLRKFGFEKYAEPVQPEEVAEIRLGSGYWSGELGEEEDLVYLAAMTYGIPVPKSENQGDSAESANEPKGAEIKPDQIVQTRSEDRELAVSVTDKAEIAELLELISYTSEKFGSNIFRPGDVRWVTIVDTDDRTYDVYIPRGALPEKYLLRFGDLQTEFQGTD